MTSRWAQFSKFVLAVLVVPLVAGCGGDQTSKPASDAPETRDTSYEATVSEIHVEMNNAMSAAFATAKLDAALVQAARTTATDSLTKMETATPPQKFWAAHDEYAAGLKLFTAILADIERQVDEPDVARRHLGDKRFTAGIAHLEKATALYAEAGFNLGVKVDRQSQNGTMTQ